MASPIPLSWMVAVLSGLKWRLEEVEPTDVLRRSPGGMSPSVEKLARGLQVRPLRSLRRQRMQVYELTPTQLDSFLDSGLFEKVAEDRLNAPQLLESTALLNVPLAQALEMATSVPAHVIRQAHRLGGISVGASADFVHLDDDQNLRGVWRGGVDVG